jgi:hypothetical protein
LPDVEPHEVSSLEQLHTLAAVEQRVVLDAGDAFYVNGRTALYRYRPSDADEPTTDLTPRLA